MTVEIEQQIRSSNEQLGQPRSMGDQPEHLREVDHGATFSRPRAAEAAAGELRALGYTASVERRLMGTTVEFSTPGPLDDASLEASTREAVAVVERHGGIYDGLAAKVVHL